MKIWALGLFLTENIFCYYHAAYYICEKSHKMKKIFTLVAALCVMGSVTFAQDAAPKKASDKKAPKKTEATAPDAKKNDKKMDGKKSGKKMDAKKEDKKMDKK